MLVISVKKQVLLILATSFLGAYNLEATLVVSESFDYPINNPGTNPSNNVSGKNGGTGFGGAWGDSGNPKINTGLTMTGVFSSGGSAVYKVNGENGNLNRPFSTDAAAALNAGTIYGSYLFSFTGTTVPTNAVTGLAIGNGSGTGNGNGDNGSFAYATKTSGVPTLSSGTKNQNTPYSMSVATGGFLENTTYLYLFTFNQSAGTTSAWVLSQDQFMNFSGNLDSANLHAAGVGTTSANVTAEAFNIGTGSVSSINYLKLFQSNSASGYSSAFDEIRFSNSSLIEAVTTVPEPAPLALAMFAGAVFGMHFMVRRCHSRNASSSISL